MSNNTPKPFTYISHDPQLDILQGTRTDMRDISVTGVSNSFSVNSKAIWDNDNKLTYESNNVSLKIFSGSTNDKPSGTGAHTVNISGLQIESGRYNKIEEIVI